MSWNTYLSLVLFYDYNQKTHHLMRHLSLFPTELIVRFNEGVDFSSFELSQFLEEKTQDIVEYLDDQALQTVRQTIMAEYARCTRYLRKLLLRLNRIIIAVRLLSQIVPDKKLTLHSDNNNCM